MAIDMNALVAALAAANTLDIGKASIATEGVGTWSSLWKANGQPAAGATAAVFSGAVNSQICTRATAGALVGWSNPAGGNACYLAGMQAENTIACAINLYDRLWACSGFVTNTATTAQSVTNPSDIPARDENGAALGVGVEPWIEVYSAPGATGATWTLTGTDEAGNTNRTWTYTHPANAETVGQMAPCFPGGASPAAGNGMRRLVSFTTSALTGSAGDIGVTLMRRLCTIPITTAGLATVLDFASTGLPEVFTDSCLFLTMLNVTGAVTSIPLGNAKIVEMTP